MKPSIIVDQVSKRYQIGSGVRSLQSLFSPRNGKAARQYHWAVKDVSFEAAPGQAVGIIGPNGAGKTTILKILSGVTKPTGGKIKVNGRLSALIELGAGFHPDLTGRENIYLNGAILGMRKAEIRQQFDSIVEFAGIGEYLDTPVKRYSSGMYARLGFAVAAHVNPQVLLVDEVLAVGDYAFQMKCHARMEALRSAGTTLLFVSHNMEAVRQVCNLGLVMYRGKAIFQGSAADAVVAYSDAIRSAARESKGDVPSEYGLAQRVMTFDAEIESLQLVNTYGEPVSQVATGERSTVCVDVRFNRPVQRPVFSLTVRTPDGRLVYDTTTLWKGIATRDFQAGERCRVTFHLEFPLLDGEYSLGADVVACDLSHYYDRMERAASFWVRGPSHSQGIVDLQAEVTFQDLAPQRSQR